MNNLYNVITDSVELANLVEEFGSTLLDTKLIKIPAKPGFFGGSFNLLDVFYIKKFDFWYFPYDMEKYYGNAFGIGKPKNNQSLNIDCELNFPKEGINRRIQCVFAKIEKGEILICHRGKIGGSKTGATKELFLKNFNGDYELVQDGRKSIELAVVCKLGSKTFFSDLERFIKEYKRIKELLNSLHI